MCKPFGSIKFIFYWEWRGIDFLLWEMCNSCGKSGFCGEEDWEQLRIDEFKKRESCKCMSIFLERNEDYKKEQDERNVYKIAEAIIIDEFP